MSEIVIVVTGQTGPSGASTSGLDDLTDVTITAAASGDILRHNGTAWVDAVGTTHFEAAGAVAAHEADTTNVHGIADTSVLETTTGSASKVSTHAALTSSVHGISAFGATLVDDADAATARTTLGVDYTTLDERTRDTIGTALTAGSGITITPNDGADTITVASSITQYTDEMARDALGTALVAGTGITITPNDGADTITIASSSALATVSRLLQNDAVKYVGIPGVVSNDTAAGQAMVADYMYYWPIYLLSAITVSEVHFAVTSAAAAGKVGLVSVVAADTDYQPTGSYTALGSALAIDSTGRKSNTGLSVTMTAGRWLLCWNANAGCSASGLTTVPIGQSRAARLNVGSGVDSQALAFNRGFTYTGSVPGSPQTWSDYGTQRCPIFLYWS